MKILNSIISTMIICLFVLPNAYAANYIVNTTDDLVLGVCDGTHCSLREAIIAANGNPGQDMITFTGINRTADPNCDAAETNDLVCTITISSTPLPQIIESLVIDGEIAENRPNIPGSVDNPEVVATKRPGIELNGANVATSTTAPVPGLWFSGANNSVVKGLVINRFPSPGILSNSSTNIAIMGNYIGTDVTGKLASTWNANFSACTANCYGNRTIGGSGIVASGTGIKIGGKGNNERNVISNNFGPGISLTEAIDGVVEGNFTGTDVLGVAAMGNRVENIEIRGYSGSTRPLVGLSPPPFIGADSEDNRIDGNIALNSKTRASLRLLGRSQLFKINSLDSGQYQYATIRNTVIINNLIGVNIAGDPRGNLAQGGISINDTVRDSKIGFMMVDGQRHPAPNIIANNVDGVTINNNTIPIIVGLGPQPNPLPTVASPCTSPSICVTQTYGNSMLYNSIYDNHLLGGIGIDLAAGNNVTGANEFAGDGVTPNDSAGHGDDKPNHLQNFPVLQTAGSSLNPDKARINGSLDSNPNREYLIQLFANAVANPTGYGEGKRYIGEMVVTTDSTGHVDFEIKTSDNPPAVMQNGECVPGKILSATATDLSTGDTSEFSQSVPVEVINGNANAYANKCD